MTNDTGHQHRHHDEADTGSTPSASPEVVGWEARYAAQGQIWSGRPNGALITEMSAERPGRALDVGCGEGADAVWLAARGWDVTGVDISAAALDRARDAAQAARVDVHWVRADVAAGSPDLGTFDLVSLQYPALPRTLGDDAIVTLLTAVAPSGTLLATWHANVNPDYAREHGFDPDDYVQHPDVLAHMDEAWTIEIDETRARTTPPPQDSPHTHDVVLRARRRR